MPWSSCLLTSAACSSAERRGCCSHAWLLLYLWPTFSSSFPLSVFSPSLWQPHRPTLPYSCGARPCGGGAEGGARFHFALRLKVLEGKHLAGPACTWPPAQPLLAATHTVHMCSVAAQSSHFPPLFSYLQDVERLQTGGGVWKGSRVWLKQDICYIIKAAWHFLQ